MIWRSNLLDKMKEINVRKFNFTLFLSEKTTRLKQNHILFEMGSSKLSENFVTLTFVHRKDFSKKNLKRNKVTLDSFHFFKMFLKVNSYCINRIKVSIKRELIVQRTKHKVTFNTSMRSSDIVKYENCETHSCHKESFLS